ncbi:MAG: hypothetical protein V1914_02530 [archaeon]
MDLTKRLFVAGAMAALASLTPGCARFVDFVRTYGLAVTDGNVHPYTFLTQKGGEEPVLLE